MTSDTTELVLVGSTDTNSMQKLILGHFGTGMWLKTAEKNVNSIIKTGNKST